MNGDLELEIDEEGVVRVAGPPERPVIFTAHTFGRFLTTLLEVMMRDGDTETIDLD